MNLSKNMEAVFVAATFCGLTLAWVTDENLAGQPVNAQTASVQQVAPEQGAQA